MLNQAVKLNNQDVFNLVRTHLLKQEVQAYDQGIGCMYHDPETGNKCAVGCLITDEFYDDNLENNSIVDENVQDAVAKSLGMEKLYQPLIDILGELQEMHDNTDPDNWEEYMATVADRYKLKVQ